MAKTRPLVLSIAGSDPSAGAGVFADLKTFEAHKVYGLGVVSAITYQNEDTFTGVDWVPVEIIIKQADLLLTKFPIKVAKIGLVESLPVLETLIQYLKQVNPDIKIIWDPILKASAGFTFHQEVNKESLSGILANLFLITPNVPEAQQLISGDTPEQSATQLSKFGPVLLKGGHRPDRVGWDTLFMPTEEQYSFRPKVSHITAKHGSGCVLSAALAANLALDYKLQRACLRAKAYTAKFLSSNPTLLGFHKL